jgi:hypothetical protein
MELGAQQIEAVDAAIVALAKFQHAFGRYLSVDFIAELYAACELGPSNASTPAISVYSDRLTSSW